MPRIDPYAQKRNARPVETREFTDPSAPGQTLTLTLTAQSNEESYLAVDESNRIVDMYITKGEPFPPVGQKPVRVSEALAASAANLYVMQRQNPDETADEFAKNKYTTEDFIALAVTWEDAWGEIVKFSRELNQRAESDRKKSLSEMQNTNSELALKA